MLTRDELIKTPCWKCWWLEGGRCYSKTLGFNDAMRNPDRPSLAQGIEITPAHIAWCNEAEALGWKPRSSKREVLERFFDPKMLTIVSEQAT